MFEQDIDAIKQERDAATVLSSHYKATIDDLIIKQTVLIECLKAIAKISSETQIAQILPIIQDVLKHTEGSPHSDISSIVTVSLPLDDAHLDHRNSVLPEDMIHAGAAAIDKASDDLVNYVSGETVDWDSGMIAVAVWRSMSQAYITRKDES